MTLTKLKVKNRSSLFVAQNRLLKESLKRLLGNGLVANHPQSSEREDKLMFLKDALNSRILKKEWLS